MQLSDKDRRILQDLIDAQQNGKRQEMVENRQVYEDILARTQDWEVEGRRHPEAIYSELMARINHPKHTNLFQTRTFRVLGSVAASLAVIIFSYLFIFQENTVQFAANNGEMKTVILPDQSEVTLNAGSRLSYDEASWGENREVRLSGQAFFKVTKGSNFDVIGTQGTVSVLGTSFNVYDRKDDYQVQCITGKVQVELASDKSAVVLTRGRQTNARNGSLIDPVAFNVQNGQAWMNGEFYFDKEPLIKVVNELERQFDLEIIAVNVEDRVYTGSFTNKDLDKALQIVCFPMGLEYKVFENGKVVIQ